MSVCPPRISKARYELVFFPISVNPPPSLFILSSCSLFPFLFPHCFSSLIPLVWPTISGMPLIQHDKCLFFPSFPQKKEQGEGIKENIELTTAGIIYTSAAALFIKPTIPGEKVPRKTQILFLESKGERVCLHICITQGWRFASIIDATLHSSQSIKATWV